MAQLQGKNIVLGISGGIAAYKSAELVRLLRKEGAQVRVCMTAAAQQFITTLTLQALSGHAVHTALLDPAAELGMGHIELARWADVLLIAPATANLLAKLAHGLADDLLTTVCLASPAPLYLAPAMNQQMWAHPATQHNVQQLAARGVHLLGPTAGEQACGDVGLGRMLEPQAIVAVLLADTHGSPLQGKRVVLTAGPTREAIDPVRFLSNRSSGKMGYALAAAAAAMGAEVTLISGPVNLPCPLGVTRTPVESAAEMYAATLAAAAAADIFIATAAVADYTPAHPAPQKIKKQAETLTLTLQRTPDIVATVAQRFPEVFTVGFAAETDNLLAYARDKLQRKGLDMIAANQVAEGKAFGQDTNALEVLWPTGHCSLPEMPKAQLARELLRLVAERYFAKQGA